MSFKVGDRVAVYGGNSGKTLWVNGKPGTIVCIFHNDGRLNVNFDDKKLGQARTFHTKQCRRLVKKERRKILVSISQTGEIRGARMTVDTLGGTQLGNFFSDNDTVEFREVRPKKTEPK